jgi:hypothetical protein
VTVEQARAAIVLAPCDGALSAVEPNMTRRDVVQDAARHINKVPVTVIDVTPSFAHHIAAIVQDCSDPVPLHFAYDPEGNIQVGWNKEEVEKRKAPKPTPPYYSDYNSIAQRLADIERARQLSLMNHQPTASELQYLAGLQRNMTAQQSQHYYEQIRNQLALAHGPTIALTPLNQLPDVLSHFAPKAKPAPAPPPKPDPTDPKFVLKRPKL